MMVLEKTDDTEEKKVAKKTNTSLSRLQTYYGDWNAKPLLRTMILDEFKGRIALISSFGADSALLLKMVAEINPETPILFLETGKHFKVTLEYVDQLERDFGLKNLIRLTPDETLLKNSDPEGRLWKTQTNRCCWLRKVEPLNRELGTGKYDAVITGRKSYQTSARQDIDNIELFDDGIFRINPFAGWNKAHFKAQFEEAGVPQHPLVAKGYPSIGCEPCTRVVKPGEDERSGRWSHTIVEGRQKEECGIHTTNSPMEETDWSV